MTGVQTCALPICKKSYIEEYRLTHRGSKGVKAYNVTEKNGTLVSLKCFKATSELDLIMMTDSGMIIKLPLEQVSTLKRATQGVRLMYLKDEQKLSTVALVEKEVDESENDIPTSEIPEQPPVEEVEMSDDDDDSDTVEE